MQSTGLCDSVAQHYTGIAHSSIEVLEMSVKLWFQNLLSNTIRIAELQNQRQLSALAITVFLIVSLLGCFAMAQEIEEWKWNDPRDSLPKRVQHQTIDSPSMKRAVGFNIYLPPEYEAEPDRRFPVVYFLHGAGGTESSDVGLANRVHAEVTAGAIPPVIYVFPNGGKRSGYRDWADQNVKSETLIVRELIPHIDKHYRTKTSPQSRGICGFSMGGNGALRLCLKYPELFGTAASLGASLPSGFDDRDGDNVFRHLENLTGAQRESLHLYLVIGDEDFLYKQHPAVIQACKDVGVRTTYVVHSRVDHNLGKYSELSANALIRHVSANIE